MYTFSLGGLSPLPPPPPHPSYLPTAFFCVRECFKDVAGEGEQRGREKRKETAERERERERERGVREALRLQHVVLQLEGQTRSSSHTAHTCLRT